jgi:hypothetical protein
LPAPPSPLTSTERKCGPILRACIRNRRIAALLPTISTCSASARRFGGGAIATQFAEDGEIDMAALSIGKTRRQMSLSSLQNTKKPETRTAGLRL